MCRAAFYLLLLAFTEFGKVNSRGVCVFGFGYEINAFVVFKNNRPVGIVISNRRWNFEPIGQLEVEFHLLA